MARKVTADDIRKMNELYYQYHSYAEVARQTNWSPSTVRAYIDKNYSPIKEENIIRFNPATDMPTFSTAMFVNVDNYGDLCVLSEAERAELEEFKAKEIEL